MTVPVLARGESFKYDQVSRYITDLIEKVNSNQAIKRLLYASLARSLA